MPSKPRQPDLFSALEPEPSPIPLAATAPVITGRFAEVAVEGPVRGTFTYRIPEHWPMLSAGTRVLVPFGHRSLAGFFLGEFTPDDIIKQKIDPAKLKAALKVIGANADTDGAPLLTSSLLALARWMARRYACPLGATLTAMLPAGVKSGAAGARIRVVAALKTPEELLTEAAAREKRRPAQAALLKALAAVSGPPLSAADLLEQAGASDSALKSLQKAGFLKISEERPDDGISDDSPPDESELHDLPLNDEQQTALEPIEAALRSGSFSGFLLQGVTGSGKTEVYLRALKSVLAAGKQGIVLVPEIALTPQTARRFQARLGYERVAILHSHVTGGERADAWRAIRNGEIDVVVGARSALFAPLPRLGIIVVDEEHETAFKQESTPRYNARDVAMELARISQAVLVLGSATPSLESLHAARSGGLRHLHLNHRVANRPLPPVEVVDLNEENVETKRFTYLSRRLIAALDQTLHRREQAILFMNRRGFATVVTCLRCGFTEKCEHCDITLTTHKATVPPASSRRVTKTNPSEVSNDDAGSTKINLLQGAHKRGFLPHLKQKGGTYFVTFRLGGTLPLEILRLIDAERNQLAMIAKTRALTADEQIRMQQLFFDKIDQYLDTGTGECWLKDASIARIVQDALSFFNKKRYLLHAWTIMPNHVHVVLTPLGEHTLSAITHSWKSFTALEANKVLGRQGQPFWQKESYDHVIRDEQDFRRCFEYTLMNPVKAGLASEPAEWQFGGMNEYSESAFGRDVARTSATTNEILEGTDSDTRRQDAGGTTAESLVCHYCNYTKPVPSVCSGCGAPGIKFWGLGTERVELEVRKAFPAARVARMDSDTMVKRTAYADALSGFKQGKIDILVGTQMIAKGLDFPNVTLVGVVLADTALHMPDFRSRERTFQLLAQVAGRAGRGEKGGNVIVQTHLPQDPAVRAAARHDFETFALAELKERRDFAYPPFTRMARVLIRGKDAAHTKSAADTAAVALRQNCSAETAQILGPSEAPIARLEGLFRWHILIKAKNSDAVTTLLAGPAGDVLFKLKGADAIVDVDPLSMM